MKEFIVTYPDGTSGFIEDTMFDAIIKILKLHWVDGNSCVSYLADENNEVLFVNDSELIEIPDTEVEMDNGDKFICDGVLFFGDGTLEFHDKVEQDAYCWDDFTRESFEKIEKIILTLLGGLMFGFLMWKLFPFKAINSNASR